MLLEMKKEIDHLVNLRQSSARSREDELMSGTSQFTSGCLGVVIERGIELYRGRRGNISKSLELVSNDTAVYVLDKPKRKNKYCDGPDVGHDMNNHWLLWRLGRPRTAKDAKKGFLWLPHANVETALICWVVSFKQERTAISQFFERHSKYEKYSWDNTVLVLNTWQTELHLSFYVLLDVASPHHAGMPAPTGDPFPGGSKQEIRRASMSFRFDGDLFDRYWTCHYVEYVPGKPREVKLHLCFPVNVYIS